AVKEGYTRAIQFDADGQHDSTQIHALFAALDDGADMAIGNRFGGQSHSYDVGRVRAQAMGLMRFVVRQFSGQRFSDTSSGFRADEVPVMMHNRELGVASNRRFKLMYHYVRLMLVITVTASRRSRHRVIAQPQVQT